MAVYTAIDNPELFFQVKLYSGSNSDLSVTFDGSENMQPDWVWLKKTSASGDHITYDSVRGVNKRLQPNATDAEVDRSGNNDELKSFNTDGWTLGTFNSNITGAGSSCVSWNWKAGTAFSNDTSSTGVGSIDSAGSISTTAGFSIITYSGTDGTATVAHGLSAVPNWIWFKRRNAAKNNTIYHSALGNTYSAYPDNTSAASTNYDYFADTSPTSSVFTVKKDEDYDETNASGGNYVAWCFSSVQGYSKFGSYEGNGNANGTFVYTGFKPAFVFCKNTENSGAQWVIADNKRVGINPVQHYLQSNSDSAQGSDTANFDFLSNGFKCRSTNSWSNQSGKNIIYMAFAESPFVNSKGVCNNAK